MIKLGAGIWRVIFMAIILVALVQWAPLAFAWAYIVAWLMFTEYVGFRLAIALKDRETRMFIAGKLVEMMMKAYTADKTLNGSVATQGNGEDKITTVH